MVICDNHSQLFIYNSREGHHPSTISIKNNDTLCDVTLTPRGNIIYTTCNSKKNVVISESGRVIITHTHMTDQRCLSTSTDDIIYLTD